MARSWTYRVRRSLEGCRPALSLRLCLFDDGYCLDLFGFLIALPFMDRWRRDPHEIMENWGVYHFERMVWFWWGSKHKTLHLPWEMTHIDDEHKVLRPDGTWVKCVASYDKGEPDGRLVQHFPYSYTLKSGVVQERIATVFTDRRQWRQRWLKWCPLFAKKRQTIEVEFNDEVGERSGSWKGGCIGCGYDMKRGETAEQTLRRMERERIFN